jgi:hypothetical protein
MCFMMRNVPNAPACDDWSVGMNKKKRGKPFFVCYPLRNQEVRASKTLGRKGNPQGGNKGAVRAF